MSGTPAGEAFRDVLAILGEVDRYREALERAERRADYLQREINKMRRAMQDAMMAEGLLLRVVKDIINFAPPLIITEAEVDELFARFTRALGAVERAEARA